MTDLFEELKRLEARVVKAEQRIPELENLLENSAVNVKDREAKLAAANAKLEKYEEFGIVLKDAFGLAGRYKLDPSAGTIGSQAIEVKDPSQIIEVADPQEPLRVSTTELRGQIAKLILEGRIDSTLVNAKAVRGRLLAEFGSAAEAWDIDTVLKELKALAAPPFRVFSFSPKNYMFRLRTGSEKRVKD